MEESLQEKFKEHLDTTQYKKSSISVVVLTSNEERNIEDCLQSVSVFAQEVFVIDSGSDDRTLEIARRYTDKIYHHSFETHARQWNWAFQNLPLTSEWILALDADQRVSPELREEIRSALANAPEDVDGFYLCRKQIFRSRWIKHGGYYPKYLLKLARRNKVHSDENELLDFRFYVPGKTLKLRSDLIEDNRKDDDLGVWKAKHERFAKLQAQEEFSRRRNGSTWKIRPTPFGTPDQKTLWLKNIWYHLPLYGRPFLYFFYRYFLRLGFLDGKEGLIFHFFQGFWYRFLVDIYLDEMRRGKSTAGLIGASGNAQCHHGSHRGLESNRH